MKSSSYVRACAAAIAALGLGAAAAPAQEHGHFEGGGRGEHLDARFAHNHYYPGRGGFVRELPGRPFVVERGGGRFFYSGGAWYAPYGPRFVVVGAPIGVFVPVLPPYYTTVWVGGLPYYYANDTYYAWHDADNGYEVVDPPSGAPQAASTQAPPSDDLFIYPQNGQAADKQASDKYECHKWAASQSGFDPTQPAGGVPPDQAGGKREDYQRAMRACLEGRGYSVR
jgi:uncharacterized protein DUF6515